MMWISLPLLYLAERSLHFRRDQVADAAQLHVAIRVGGRVLEDHLTALEHGAFRHDHDGVFAGRAIAIIDQ